MGINELEEGRQASQDLLNQHLFGEILRKYVSVWLWSVLFGTSTGLLYTLIDLDSERWGPLALVVVIPIAISGLWALLSWLHLYRCLAWYLIPKFICATNGQPDEKQFAYYLKRAFFYLILSALFRISASMIGAFLFIG